MQADIWGLRRELGELERKEAELHEEFRGLSRNVDRYGRLSKTALRQSKKLDEEIAAMRDRTRLLKCQVEERRARLVAVEADLRATYRGLAQYSDPDLQELEGPSRTSDGLFRYDVFVSHASQDKATVVRPLVKALQDLGLHVWFDEVELKVGDDLRASLDRGLRESRFGIVVLSPDFLCKKKWTAYELDSLFLRDVESGNVILPIWHKLSKDEVIAYSPKLADKVALHTSLLTVTDIALEIAIVVYGQDMSRA